MPNPRQLDFRSEPRVSDLAYLGSRSDTVGSMGHSRIVPVVSSSQEIQDSKEIEDNKESNAQSNPTPVMNNEQTKNSVKRRASSVRRPAAKPPSVQAPGPDAIESRPGSRASVRSDSSRDGSVRSSTRSSRKLRKKRSKAASLSSEYDNFRKDTKLKRQLTTSTTSARSTTSTVNSKKSMVLGEITFPWTRTVKGESMEQLIDTGFFDRNEKAGKRKITRLPVLDGSTIKKLPFRPTSMVLTPTSFYTPYHGPPTPLMPLDQIGLAISSLVPSEDLGYLFSVDEVDESDANLDLLLPEIPEIPPLQVDAENIVAGSATLLRLSSGGVITVIKPESDAWRQSVFKHGPICLEKPRNGLLRSGRHSVMSLAVWQEDVVPSASQSSSDDAVLDDLLNFFEPMLMGPEQRLKELDENVSEDETLAAPLLDSFFIRQNAELRMARQAVKPIRPRPVTRAIAAQPNIRRVVSAKSKPVAVRAPGFTSLLLRRNLF